MYDTIVEIIASQLKISIGEIDGDADIVEVIGADSLDIVDIIDTIEERFSVTVPDEDIENLRTVNDVVNYLQNKY